MTVVLNVTPPSTTSSFAVPVGATSIQVAYTTPQTKLAQYGIIVTPSWATITWISEETLNGCVINFSPASNAPTNTINVITTITSGTTTVVTAPVQSGTQAILSDLFVQTMGVATHLAFRYQNNDTTGANLLWNFFATTGIRFARDGGSNTNFLAAVASHTVKFIMVCDPGGGVPDPTLATTVYTAAVANIWAVEGPNEPDDNWSGGPHRTASGGSTYLGQGWPTGIIAYQNALYATIKGAGGSWAGVLVASFSLAHVDSTVTSSLNAANTPILADLGNMHNYQTNTNLPNDQLVAGVPNSSSKNWSGSTQSVNGLAGVQLVTTECGWQNNEAAPPTGLADRSLAKYWLRIYAEQFYAQYAYAPLKIVRTHPYDVATVDSPTYSIINTDGSFRPAAFALQYLIALLTDASYGTYKAGLLNYTVTGLPAFTNTGGGGRQLLFQNSSGVFFIMLWTNDKSWTGALDVDFPYTITVNFYGSPPTSVELHQPTFSNTAVQTWTSAGSITTTVNLDQVTIFKVVGAGASTGGGGTTQATPDLVYFTWASGNFGAATDASDRGPAIIAADSSAPGNYGYSVLVNMPASTGDQSAQINMVLVQSRQTAYASFWYYQPANFPDNDTVIGVTQGIIKLIRFRELGYGLFSGTLIITGNQYAWFYDQNAAHNGNVYATGNTPDQNRGSWHLFKVFNDVSSNGTVVAKVWIDGTLVINTSQTNYNPGLTFGIVSPGGDVNATPTYPVPALTFKYGAMGLSDQDITKL